MKRLTLALTLILSLAGIAFAAPDVESAKRHLVDADQQLTDTLRKLDFADNRVLRLSGLLADKDKERERLRADDAKELARVTADFTKQLNDKQAVINDMANRQNKALGLIGQVAGGGVFLIGAFFLAFGEKPAGFKLMAAGLLVASISQAFSRWGWMFAVGGVVASIVIGIYETVANRTSGIEIADGLKQAVLAGKVKWSDLWEHVDQATFGRAKSIIKKATT